ncbi:hypothetical protein LTR37_011389 [Vermiconidia calcicola]|uniref:Uncharacterized protein n=1 Tax=Vermiconidia calcicola TaxID=1690605 RepID=A0ACC3N2P7_9PEZI|nr:hypothetical protein LTR37_011389 [Vermiconidia calcicola]
MINGKLAVPLSPPTSPRMSETGAKLDDYQPQQAPNTAPNDVAVTLPRSGDARSRGMPQVPQQPAGEEHSGRPSLRSYKSFPYSMGPSSRRQDEASRGQSTADVLGGSTQRVLSQGPQATATSNLRERTYGGSAPTSPIGHLTPDSSKVEQNENGIDMEMEDDDLDSDAAELEEEAGRPPKTAAELRAQKRKMKRFRLTHNQTRFLMSEFARQAHPDAAHRERLSREIPGLSPRQVQVWFQNRRAKLKRLTTDDRERMMRSRALPAGFDMTQALHSPFGASTPTAGTPTASAGTFAPFAESSGLQPLTLDTLRRGPEYKPYAQQYVSPTGMTPSLGAFGFTPPQSATETMSPGSVASPFSFQPQESPRRQPFGVPLSAQPGYPGHTPSIPRLHTHERFARPGGEVTASPLRTSMSYSGLAAASASQGQTERTQSFSEHPSYTHDRPRAARSVTNPNAAGSGPYGLGFSYAHNPPYQPMEQGQSTSLGMSQQPSVEWNNYRRSSSQLAGPPISYAQYPSANFQNAQVPQYSSFISQQFGSPYQQASAYQDLRNDIGQRAQQTYTPVAQQPSQFARFTGSSSNPEEPGDNSDGGVAVEPY